MMHIKYQLISAIHNEPWLLALTYNLDYINALITGVTNPNITSEANTDLYNPQTNGRVVIIPIIGVLTKYDGFCGAPGMISYGERISEAINDSSVDAIVLSVDSPGGQFSGIQSLASIIENSTKPIIGYIDDTACSGAYWLMSMCKSVVAGSATAIVGSIGVMATYTDLTEANKLAGRKEHIIYAPQSGDKNKKVAKVFSGDYSGVQSDLKVLAECFISEVKKGRPSVTEGQLTGETFFAGDVVGTLVDSVGSIDTAISTALSLVNKNKSEMPTPKTTRLATVVGVESFEVSADGLTLNHEQIVAAESHLEASAALEAQNRTLTTNLATANETIANLTSELSNYQARVAALEAVTPGSNPSTVSPAADGEAAPKAKTQAEYEAEAKLYL